MKHPEQALASYDKAIALKSDFVEAYAHRGNALAELKRPEDALSSYDKAIALGPDHEFLYGTWVYAKTRICDWSDLEKQIGILAKKVERSEKATPPFSLLAISDSPALHRASAESAVAAKFPSNNSLPAIAKRPRRNKIRLGYFSADFREHPVAALIAELFEKHDRSRFEVIAFSFGPDANDDMRKRLKRAFDQFIDVKGQSDREVALLARSL